jgi:nitrate/nitrite transport system substrate-binding protein
VWNLTQLRRWGLITEVKPDAWYLDVAKKTYRPDIYMKAAAALVAEGKAQASEFPAEGTEAAPPSTFIDGKAFDFKVPNAYIDSLSIGLKSK